MKAEKEKRREDKPLTVREMIKPVIESYEVGEAIKLEPRKKFNKHPAAFVVTNKMMPVDNAGITDGDNNTAGDFRILMLANNSGDVLRLLNDEIRARRVTYAHNGFVSKSLPIQLHHLAEDWKTHAGRHYQLNKNLEGAFIDTTPLGKPYIPGPVRKVQKERKENAHDSDL